MTRSKTVVCVVVLAASALCGGCSGAGSNNAMAAEAEFANTQGNDAYYEANAMEYNASIDFTVDNATEYSSDDTEEQPVNKSRAQ